jgi:hypothetical protein
MIAATMKTIRFADIPPYAKFIGAGIALGCALFFGLSS